MAEFKEANAVKEELLELQTPDQKERRKRVIRTAENLDDMVDEAIEVFTLLHADAMAEFDARMELKRANATVYGEPVKATAEEKNMEVRVELWFPTVAVPHMDSKGRIHPRYRDLKGVLAAIYRYHGFEDFPNAQNRSEFLMLKRFLKRHPRFGVAEKL